MSLKAPMPVMFLLRPHKLKKIYEKYPILSNFRGCPFILPQKQSEKGAVKQILH